MKSWGSHPCPFREPVHIIKVGRATLLIVKGWGSAIFVTRGPSALEGTIPPRSAADAAVCTGLQRPTLFLVAPPAPWVLPPALKLRTGEAALLQWICRKSSCYACCLLGLSAVCLARAAVHSSGRNLMLTMKFSRLLGLLSPV